MKKIITNFYFIFFLFFTAGVYGQLQNAVWYFGDHAGLDFNTTPPTVLTDGQTPSDYSRSATVCDSDGELLFYTDGHVIWNKEGNIMTGSSDSLPYVTGVVIIPFPSDSDKYIVFKSVYNSDNRQTEYYYSVVNMHVGLGEVELLNALSDLPTSEFTNNLVVAKHHDNSSFWLISVTDHYNISSLLIDDTGPTNTVVTSVLPMEFYPIVAYVPLRLKVSPDNSKMAFGTHEVAIGGDKKSLSKTENNNRGSVPELYIFNFDDNTGYLTPYFIDDVNADYYLVAGYMDYVGSVEFSGNSDFLYVMGEHYVNEYDSSQVVIQLDISGADTPNVLFSYTFSPCMGACNYPINIRRAMNDKIYMTSLQDNKSHYLSVINNPNLSGASCNVSEYELYLGASSTRKLPPLVLFQEPQCPTDLPITQDVLSGETDIQEASNSITATNTIFSGGTAEYDAGNFVLLDVGFKAEAGPITKTSYSHFYAYIEGCSGKVERDEYSSANDNSSEDSQSRSLEEYTPIKLYPNPTKGVLTIESNSDVISWEIQSTFGELQFTGGSEKKTINTANLPNGIYYIKGLLKDGKTFSKTFIKQ